MPSTSPTRVLDLPVRGMHCASCVGRVERILRAVPGVSAASVSLAGERARVEGPVALGDALSALARGGYTTPTQVTTVDGPVPVADLEAVLGVVAVAGSDDGGVAVTYVDADGVLSAIRDAARGAGGRLGVGRVSRRPSGTLADDACAWRRRTLVAALLTVTLTVLGAHGPRGALPAWALDARLHLVLASLLLVGPARPLLLGAWRALRRRAPDMDLLVGLGIVATFGVAAVRAISDPFAHDARTDHDSTFAALGLLVSLVALGRFLDARVRRRANAAVARLGELAPAVAHRVVDGREDDLPVDEVLPGDVVRVRPGERLPADGVVLEGGSDVDESALTGESVPVEKAAGGRVHAGTRNAQGTLLVRVELVGAASALGRIERLVLDAQTRKASIERFADRVAGRFVPIVVGIALLAALAWFVVGPEPRLATAIGVLAAVLVVACPCALGLATPAAVAAGSGRAASVGIVVRGGDVLERLARVDTVLFDKTGTITEGRPTLARVVALGLPEEALLRLAAAVERASEHPYARAIVAAATARGISIPAAQAFRATTGGGVSGAVVDEAGILRTIVVGRAEHLAAATIDASPLVDAAARAADVGETPILVGLAGSLGTPARALGLLALTDAARPEAADVVARLHRLGISTGLVSGDRGAVARRVAARVGIDDVTGDATPEEKVAVVARRRAAGARIAFVGDGINDAPALAAADAGIALGTGTDVALEAGDVALVRADLHRVADAIVLARRTLGVARQNLAFAFAYNVVAIPAAAGAFVPFGVSLPASFAAGAMAASSLLVVGNALRLSRARLDDGRGARERPARGGAGTGGRVGP